MLKENMESIGCDGPKELFGDKWDGADPLGQEDVNRNLLAWFGFEETARKLADRNSIEA